MWRVSPGQAGHDQRETKLKCNKTERDTGRVWTQAEETAHYAELTRGNIVRPGTVRQKMGILNCIL